MGEILQVMRHFIHGQSGDLLLFEDGRALLVALVSGSRQRFRWDTKATLFLPDGTSLGVFDFKQFGVVAQFVSAWNNNPAAAQYGTLSAVLNYPLFPFALALRGTVTPQLEVVISIVPPFVVNGKRLQINGQNLLINA